MTSFIYEPTVEVLAHTTFDQQVAEDGGWVIDRGEPVHDDIDELHEFAGRQCYLSWNRPNPKTNTNENYLAHIHEVNHLSVLGHGHVTFMVRGVSRSLLQELVRHQQRYSINLSVLSQRYVDHSEANFVVPPILSEMIGAVESNDDIDARVEISRVLEQARSSYCALVEIFVRNGYSRKEARGAARCVLPEGTETQFVVTGSIRAFCNIIEQRLSPAADAEIARFAERILEELIGLCPNSIPQALKDLLEEDK